jgi:hypothetical protein
LHTENTSDYRRRILVAVRQLLADGRPRRAREIAAALSMRGRIVDRRDVSSVLYHEGAGQFQYNATTYQYTLRSRPEVERPIPPRPALAQQPPAHSYPPCNGTCTVMVIDSDGIPESRPCSCPRSKRNLR